ncbi:hypothetical protein ARALYDRAFT_909949 [Arabidopsis lyrata subsp. lyrata]|uniref:Defensin-like domain-containing protein n=1 Tax=Arabidopsis lyrata subsp. lyrata TaxID=81972 RepID=D7LYM5_ARALL|nr:putative defensin-like protein 48 [Arabidopsis lyrata subsp. lyrata]EFH50196.1 hypothetical protein ARALYDRAFT_909949 [Arabidopsis lyrata subsp. lyrata]|eukprot:XP_002873937.1 putative defensin-like protein 48 [Arabidopsis lyrata subsp. lyrata]
MGTTKNLVIFFHIVILTVLFNEIILVSGEEVEEFPYDHCFQLCVEGVYGPQKCFEDCYDRGFARGDCANPTAKDPRRCCCNN